MRGDYLIRQKPMHALLVFAMPIILGNLFQQTYTMVDSAMVGRFVSEQALAAVGPASSSTNICSMRSARPIFTRSLPKMTSLARISRSWPL